MYKITFCRTSRFYINNKKGSFIKEFKTLDEIVKLSIDIKVVLPLNKG